MDITGIDLFYQNVGMACAEVRGTCSWVSLVLIYLIKMNLLFSHALRRRRATNYSLHDASQTSALFKDMKS